MRHNLSWKVWNWFTLYPCYHYISLSLSTIIAKNNRFPNARVFSSIFWQTSVPKHIKIQLFLKFFQKQIKRCQTRQKINSSCDFVHQRKSVVCGNYIIVNSLCIKGMWENWYHQNFFHDCLRCTTKKVRAALIATFQNLLFLAFVNIVEKYSLLNGATWEKRNWGGKKKGRPVWKFGRKSSKFQDLQFFFLCFSCSVVTSISI